MVALNQDCSVNNRRVTQTEREVSSSNTNRLMDLCDLQSGTQLIQN